VTSITDPEAAAFLAEGTHTGKLAWTMEGDSFDEARYGRMRWNTPLPAEHAELLMDRLDLRPGARVADLGCGWGELLLRVVARAGQATGTGLDTDAAALSRARRLAAGRHLDGQVQFTEADVTGWNGTADRVLHVGSSHALGGTTPALDALAGTVPAGGRLLFGDGYWERIPLTRARPGSATGSMPANASTSTSTGACSGSLTSSSPTKRRAR
jgi:SAM-dependent methyltransferase